MDEGDDRGASLGGKPGEGALAREFEEASLEGRLQGSQDDEQSQQVYEIHLFRVPVSVAGLIARRVDYHNTNLLCRISVARAELSRIGELTGNKGP